MSRPKPAKHRQLSPGMRWALGLSAGASAIAMLLPGSAIPSGTNSTGAYGDAPAGPASHTTVPQVLPENLATALLEPAESDPFAAPLVAPPPPAPPVAAIAPPPPPAPTAPALNYRYLGQMMDLQGQRKVYLARPDKELLVEQGTLLDEGYRVEAITADEIKLLYEPMQYRTSIRIPSDAPNPS